MYNLTAIEVKDNYLGNLVFPVYDTAIARIIKDSGVWEPNEFDWVLNNVSLGDTCINIGSNVGYFTCLMSKQTGPNGKVFSIEANKNFEYFLKENSKRMEHDNIEIIMSAAGNFSGTVKLFINSENCGDNRVFNPDIILDATDDIFSEGRETTEVPIDKVDNLISTKKIDVVLIDCQGWDHEVIRGMKDIIKESHPKILTEFVPSWIKYLDEDPEQILKEYQNFGYNLLCPDLKINNPCSPTDILTAIKNKKVWFTNIYLEPKI